MVLEGYKKYKNNFINPLDANLPNLYKVSYLDDTCPNILWIALIYESKGLDEAIKLIGDFMLVIDEVKGKKIKGLIYEFNDVSDDEWDSIRDKLEGNTLKRLMEILSPLVELYPECPLNRLFKGVDIKKEKNLETLLKVTANLTYKPSKTASLSMGLFLDSLIRRKIFSMPDKAKENFDIIFLENNWESERAKSIRPSIRASIIMFLDKNKRKLWAEYFWKRGFEISKCDALLDYYMLKDSGKSIKKELSEPLARDFSEIVKDVYEIHGEAFKSVVYTSKNFEELEINLGLFNRIFNLSKRLLQVFEYWNDELGKVVLRSIIDSYILLAWLQSNGTEENLRNYKEYGLGKKKLFIEHLKSKIGNDALNPFYKRLENELNAELESIINPMFLNVNVGNWIDKSVRDMAMDIDEKELFDYLYNPFSDIIHGGYSSLEQHHLRNCYNPLHKGHKIPKEVSEKLDFMIPLLCIKIIIKTIEFGKKKLNLNISDKAITEISELYDRLVENSFHG